MIERFGAFAVGIALVAAAIFVPGVLNAGAVPVVLVIAGGGLLVWAFVAERLKAFGPKGLELFRAAREQTAQTAPTPRPRLRSVRLSRPRNSPT